MRVEDILFNQSLPLFPLGWISLKAPVLGAIIRSLYYLYAGKLCLVHWVLVGLINSQSPLSLSALRRKKSSQRHVQWRWRYKLGRPPRRTRWTLIPSEWGLSMLSQRKRLRFRRGNTRYQCPYDLWNIISVFTSFQDNVVATIQRQRFTISYLTGKRDGLEGNYKFGVHVNCEESTCHTAFRIAPCPGGYKSLLNTTTFHKWQKFISATGCYELGYSQVSK